MLKFMTAGILGLSLWLPASAFALTPDERSAIEGQIAEIDASIGEADDVAMRYDAGAIKALAEARSATLALTRAILGARIAAHEAGTPTEIVLPTVQPNLELAEELEAEIATQEEVVAAAESEAQSMGGLIQAVALSRVEAEKLNLARLRGALIQARYGATLPVELDEAAQRTASAPSAPQDATGEQEDDPLADATAEVPEWADPDHPEIDYTDAVFSQYVDQDFRLAGWWAISETRAEVDDSPRVFAHHLQTAVESTGFMSETPSIQIGCSEGQMAFVYDTDDFILTDFQQNGIDVTYRIDDEEARSARWGELTSSKGAGVFQNRAITFLKGLYGADKAFFRIVERNGERHDTSFDLAGTSVAVDAAAAACGVSMLDLSRDDFRAIQEMLNAGGYDAGTPDGVWGSGSKDAMRSFQEDNGISPTGAPDRATLAAMGLEF